MSEGTRSEDYSSTYYDDAHLGGYDHYTWDNDEWRTFFLSVADRIVGVINPRTVLDVGSARGLLVQALASRDVDASGIDISEHAVQTAHEDVRDRLRVGSAIEPLGGPYDLVTCIEVLEHMAPADAQRAMDSIAAATDRVLFSSSPADHDEPTHVNTRPTEQWAAWFAERGFFRRTDVDLSFISPWAVLFERADLTVRDVVQAYEAHLAALTAEVVDARNALLAAHRDISDLRDGHDGTKALVEQAALMEQLEKVAMEARHAQLLSRDHVVGIEAEIGRQNADILRLTGDLRRLQGREKRLTSRKTAQAKRIAGLQSKLTAARKDNAALKRRVRELEADLDKPSLARRVVRRLRGPRR